MSRLCRQQTRRRPFGGNRATHNGGREWDAPNASHAVCVQAGPALGSIPTPAFEPLPTPGCTLRNRPWKLVCGGNAAERVDHGPPGGWRSLSVAGGVLGEAEAHLWRSVPLNHPAAGGGNHECAKVVRCLGTAKGLGSQV